MRTTHPRDSHGNPTHQRGSLIGKLIAGVLTSSLLVPVWTSAPQAFAATSNLTVTASASSADCLVAPQFTASASRPEELPSNLPALR
jgi:hypothetical protein